MAANPTTSLPTSRPIEGLEFVEETVAALAVVSGSFRGNGA
ncbi:MAG: hypothetical protein WAN75_20445 [Xanthobacteraceae bacterium]|jgi:hypothetical protein